MPWAVAALALAGSAWAGEEAEDLIAAIRAEGCAVTPATRAAVLARAGLDGEAADGLLAAVVRAGLAEVGGPEVTVLTPTACAGVTPRADFSLVVVAAREAGCVLSRSEAARALAPLGQGEEAVDRVFGELWDAGEGWTEGTHLHLTRGLCRGLPGAPAMTARREAEAADWVEARLGAEPGCRLSRGSLAAEGVAVGIGPADIDRAVASLHARERLAEVGEEPRLAAGACP